MNSAAASDAIAVAGRLWQLPADVSVFVGRTDELATLAALLRGARLVTVAGPGGIGKTRLALRAAADGGHPDGACLIELDSLTDERQLLATIARGLGLHGNDPQALTAAILDHLRARRLLLILDTCEHLTAACARFAALVLAEAPGVTILTTSRQPLHLAGEQVLRLGPLPLPGPGAGDERSPGDAVEMFTTRAAAARGGFTVTPATLPDVIRLCRRLDGIPLALELAAVRVRALPLTEIISRLDAGLGVLTGTRRGMTARHQTLRAVTEWSYDLANGEERTVLDRLSVFAGSFDLAAARSVAACAQIPADRVGGALAGLADKSIVLSAEDGERYRLLDSVREYAAERLAWSGQADECRIRHVRWYRDRARDFGRHLAADDQPARLARLRAEQANLRAALAVGLAGAGVDAGAGVGAGVGIDPGAGIDADLGRAAVSLANALVPYWLTSGALREGMHWQEKALARLAGLSGEPSGEPGRDRARTLAGSALLGALLGRPQAVAQARAAIADAARAGDERIRARGHLALQLALAHSGAYPQALEMAARARRLLTGLGADTALRCLDVQLAHTLQLGGEFTAAAELGQRTLAALPAGERWLRGAIHLISALALYRQPGRTADCARAAGDALLIHQELAHPVGAACALEVFGWLAADDGRDERAAWLLGAAQARWERAGGRLGGSNVLEGYHRKAARIAGDALGAQRYADLHARGAAWPPGQIAALAIGETGTLPSVPGPRPGRDSPLGAPGASGAGRDAGDGTGWAGAGTDKLTGRERQIAALVVSGLSNREIAARLVISQRTVDAHVNHIFGKVGVSSRVQLTRRLSDHAALG